MVKFKAWAAKSGLGWIGKHSNLINNKVFTFHNAHNEDPEIELPQRYAKAILSLSLDLKKADQVHHDMLLMSSTIEENEELQIMLDSSVVKTEAKRATLSAIFDNKIDSILTTINKDSLVIDSLMKLRPKVITRYKTKYDTIYRQAPDTCKSYLAELNAECMALDSFNLGIITRQETQLISYSELVGTMSEQSNMYVLRHTKDSLSILKLDKKLKRTRKFGIAAFGFGFVGGLLIR